MRASGAVSNTHVAQLESREPFYIEGALFQEMCDSIDRKIAEQRIQMFMDGGLLNMKKALEKKMSNVDSRQNVKTSDIHDIFRQVYKETRDWAQKTANIPDEKLQNLSEQKCWQAWVMDHYRKAQRQSLAKA